MDMGMARVGRRYKFLDGSGLLGCCEETERGKACRDVIAVSYPAAGAFQLSGKRKGREELHDGRRGTKILSVDEPLLEDPCEGCLQRVRRSFLFIALLRG